MVDTEIDYPTKLDLSTVSGAPLLHSATPSAQNIDKLQGFDTIWESQLETLTPALNMHQVVNRLHQSNGSYYHLFHDFTAYANLKIF